VVGPADAAQSTLLKILAGLVPPSAGEARWHGQSLEHDLPDVTIILQRNAWWQGVELGAAEEGVLDGLTDVLVNGRWLGGSPLSISRSKPEVIYSPLRSLHH
jgi:ABC-type cobalamin/Fe3+-siderophores transport system ATPase subunit